MHEISASLPGHELVRSGLEDLAAGRETEAALVVAMAAPRLRAIGLHVPPAGEGEPSHRLYDLLSERNRAGAHSRYNALIRRMVSFCRAAEGDARGVDTPAPAVLEGLRAGLRSIAQPGCPFA